MRKQTFIISLIDKNACVINFERWSYKRLNTCINKMVELYRHMREYGHVREELNKTVFVVVHEIDYLTQTQNLVWQISKDEFLQLINA